MTLAIEALLRQQPLSAAAIDRFLEDHEFPLVEDPLTGSASTGTSRAESRTFARPSSASRALPSCSVTFVYRGEADGVRLQHFVYGLETSQAFDRIDGTDLWYLVLTLPRESNVQYKLSVRKGEAQRWILDPFNPERALDPFGANSLVHTDGAARPGWTLPDPDVRPGALQEVSFYSAAFAGERYVRVFLPARLRQNRLYPLLIVHDGSDYLRYSSLKTVLDNLIHRLEIAPMIVALTDPGDRLKEYADDPRQARFLTEELLPFFEKEFPIRAEPAARGLMGASFGGVASLSCAWRYPGTFGCLLLQSGSFGFSDIGPHHHGPSFDPVVEFVNAFRAQPGRPSERVFVSCGMYESLIYENRSMLPVLQATGMDVHYVEARDGHNWANWRNRLREGLSWLFPGPLWMVYE
jgi:enterochelin esterase-like enzyme